jgi:uncharacterized protein (DUF433 family)
MKIIHEELKDIIESQPDVLDNAPCFKGTRVPVSVILEYLALGWSINDLKESYPSVKTKYIEKLIRTYAKKFTTHAVTA